MPRSPVRRMYPSSSGRRSHWVRTPINLQTVRNMEARGFRTSGVRLASGAESYIYDSSNPDYSWLLAGWIAEERVLPHGRVYRYYYDPHGRQYKNKYEVLDHWARLGVIVLDS